jgi:hypothetical protein
MILQENNKIVILGTGTGTTDLSNTYVLARYNTNGTIDNIFGTTGILSINQISNNINYFIAQDTDNNIIIFFTNILGIG